MSSSQTNNLLLLYKGTVAYCMNSDPVCANLPTAFLILWFCGFLRLKKVFNYKIFRMVLCTLLIRHYVKYQLRGSMLGYVILQKILLIHNIWVSPGGIINFISFCHLVTNRPLQSLKTYTLIYTSFKNNVWPSFLWVKFEFATVLP